MGRDRPHLASDQLQLALAVRVDDWASPRSSIRARSISARAGIEAGPLAAWDFVDPTAAAGTQEQIVIKPRTRRSDTTKNLPRKSEEGLGCSSTPIQQETSHSTRSGKRTSAGRWVQCTPTGRRPAIKAVIDGEEPMPSRGYPGEPIRRKRAAASWSTYRRTRSGVMTAWNQAVNEANPRLNRFLLFKMTGFQGPAGIRAASGPIPDTQLPPRAGSYLDSRRCRTTWSGTPLARGIHARHRSEDSTTRNVPRTRGDTRRSSAADGRGLLQRGARKSAHARGCDRSGWRTGRWTSYCTPPRGEDTCGDNGGGDLVVAPPSHASPGSGRERCGDGDSQGPGVELVNERLRETRAKTGSLR